MKTRETSLISVENLYKEFKLARRGEGLKGAIGYLFSRKYDVVKAVDGVSFKISPGEMVGYIGRNGAGKSTTIKMLTGILVPTSGKVEVDGIIPYKKRAENGKRIGVVFGQRTQLRWDIPVIETFRLLKEVYQIPQKTYTRNLELFSDILELNGLLSTPVRKLSLGQRMKCDLAASLLHDPRIVYLDEPTIGLDIVVKENVREFIKAINRERGTTVILTTHDLNDIDDICQRAIIIDNGKVVYDGRLQEIKDRFGKYRILTFEVKERLSEGIEPPLLPQGMESQEFREHHIKIRIDREVISASETTRYIMDTYEVLDISIEEPSIETVVKKIYREGWNAPG
jgi:ABC-2 type transport system ATP-binding protein